VEQEDERKVCCFYGWLVEREAQAVSALAYQKGTETSANLHKKVDALCCFGTVSLFRINAG